MNVVRPGLVAVSLALLVGAAQADAVSSLRAFVKDVQQAQAQFTQTVTSPDGKKVRKSTGSLAFQRPDRFRFDYKAPIEQLIVGDGRQVWLYDTDLNQVTVRPMTQAMGATPAALLSGQSLDKDFVLKAVPPASVAVKPSGAVS
ncbi:MAG TPA: outer membrane lipoprotein chaperone LolA, partial [Aquabacterium sp.]|nr:outer membrane lipoprotein chaperone LolA [Aquabacterium sp.]